MARAFTDADLIQSPPAATSVADNITAALPNPTVEGNCGLIILKTSTVIGPPLEWDSLYEDGAGRLAVMYRADVVGGESSWAFTFDAGALEWVWKVEEWANIAWKGPEGIAKTNSGTPGSASIATGNTDRAFTAEYVVGFLAVGLFKIVADTVTFPAMSSFSDSFVQADELASGDGTTVGDCKLWVARRYGTQNDTGPWSCTATFAGPTTNMIAQAVLVVLGAME